MENSLSSSEVAKKIAKTDSAFKKIIELAGPPPSRRASKVENRFPSIARAITSQLLATNAAETIHARVVEVCKGSVTEQSVIRAGADKLKSAGLNRTKAEAMVELATMSLDGRIQLHRHGRMTDEEIVHEVTSVRGIGPWTAQMYLLSTLARADVWPIGDYAVRVGWSILHDLEGTISEKDLRLAGEPFLGIRSSVAWYCWRAVHFSRNEK
jgi:3-methyladenine DNA glycosylase/8-oxoguanine DNA glycosylase